jgi:nicotinate-nucleotide adenylyltransferase
MKIGILGGTFNPIHIGHLILAEEIREKLNLGKVIFVPTYIAPHKDNVCVAKAKDRFQMIKLAIRGNQFFSVSDREIKRKGLSYTIDTLKEFKKQYTNKELYFITGSDLLNYLNEWKDLNEIIKMVKFVVVTRPGYPLEKIPSYIQTQAIRAVDISAFEIRQAIKEGKSFRYLVADTVYDYINKHKLYRKMQG